MPSNGRDRVFSRRHRVALADWAGLILSTALVLAVSSPATGAEGYDEILIARELERTTTDPDSVASVSIAAPVEFVFQFLTRRPQDYTADAVAVSFDHSEAEITGEPGRGSERAITLADGEVLVQRFLHYQAPASYAYLTDMNRSTFSAPLKYVVTRYELTAETAETTRLRVALVYEPTTRLLAFFVKRALGAALQDDFDRAAALIGSEWAGLLQQSQ